MINCMCVLLQGHLYKKSNKPLNKDWKKKYVTLATTGMLTYFPSINVSSFKNHKVFHNKLLLVGFNSQILLFYFQYMVGYECALYNVNFVGWLFTICEQNISTREFVHIISCLYKLPPPSY